MAVPVEDTPLVLPAMVFRPVRLGIISVVLTIIATGACWMMHRPALGLFFGLGLAIGLVNALLVRYSVTQVAAMDHPLKSKMVTNSAGRLFVITVLAFLLGYFFRPSGIGTIFGVAFFELLLIASATRPVLHQLQHRASSIDGTAEGITQ